MTTKAAVELLETVAEDLWRHVPHTSDQCHGGTCWTCSSARRVDAAIRMLRNSDPVKGQVDDHLLQACKAALLLAGDGDLADNGEYSGAAITDQIRAAVAKAEGGGA